MGKITCLINHSHGTTKFNKGTVRDNTTRKTTQTESNSYTWSPPLQPRKNTEKTRNEPERTSSNNREQTFTPRIIPLQS